MYSSTGFTAALAFKEHAGQGMQFCRTSFRVAAIVSRSTNATRLCRHPEAQPTRAASRGRCHSARTAVIVQLRDHHLIERREQSGYATTCLQIRPTPRR
jgi:hypothetical protein